MQVLVACFLNLPVLSMLQSISSHGPGETFGCLFFIRTVKKVQLRPWFLVFIRI
jgi:hypothetical protein